MPRIIQRALQGMLLLVGVSVCTFGLLAAAPGNSFDELLLNPQISADTVAALKSQFGLGDPVSVRYARWFTSMLRGQFGYSFSYQRPVGSLVWIRARNTLLLTVLATVLAWLVALPWGILEAINSGKWFDRVGSLLTAILLAIPDTLLALLLLLLAARTGWFPTGGMRSATMGETGFAASLQDAARHFFLPVVGLSLGAVPILVRHTRAAMIAVRDSPFIEAARSHGIPKWRLIYRHALPAALNPLISLFGLSVGTLLSMSLIMEVVLGWPGLGPLVIEAVLSRDVYVVMAVVMLASLFLVVGNILADLLLYWNDPRVRTAAP